MRRDQVRIGRKVELCGTPYIIVSTCQTLDIGGHEPVEFCSLMTAKGICFNFLIEALCLPKDDPERTE